MKYGLNLIFSSIIIISCCTTKTKTEAQSRLRAVPPSGGQAQTYKSMETKAVDSSLHKYTNHLINETSPYLLQHAHNPVNWYPWGDEALEKAAKENKLILVSIGYSACHWCHVMEHESFEDEEVAKIMNDNFVCIKVDREERPDIDQIYMNAVHLMNKRGGWPLNCFTLPDGKPFFGGTYFPKQQWIQILEKVAQEYKDNPDNVREYAEKLTQGIRQSELIQLNTEPPLFAVSDLNAIVEKWSKSFDNKEGGPDRAPKFPLPNNYQFLLQYSNLTNDNSILEHVTLTLDKMAYGGIYDQIGGGFARYSTDALWKVPHFEKMLYDNAQLVTLYSEAYQATKSPLYKQVVYETLEYIEREMTAPVGAFYSALDADSEGEEGKYYVWKKDELKEILGDKFALFANYYNVNSTGLWEHGNYILLRKKSDEVIAKKHDMTVEELLKEIGTAKKKLLAVREKRVKPGLDDKSLTSWNALMLKGYADAYNVFNEPKFLKVALKNANFILTTVRRDDGGLFHSYKKGRTKINGYLEDYAFTIEAFITLYEATFDEKWLNTAKELMEYAIEHFHDKTSGMFYFTSDLDKALIARKMEVNDNVIPASNSSIAKSLFMLGHYFDDLPTGQAGKNYNEISTQMLNNVKNYMSSYGSGYSNWGLLMLNRVSTFYEVAIVGKDANQKRAELNQYYIPNKMLIGSKQESSLPLLENKYVNGETIIYVCIDKSCKLPVSKVSEAVKQMQTPF